MVFCIKCGAGLPDDADFCIKCGRKVLIGVYFSAKSGRVMMEDKLGLIAAPACLQSSGRLP